MNHSCLNTDQLRLLIKSLSDSLEPDDHELGMLFANCRDWSHEISVLTYLLTRCIDKFSDQEHHEILDLFYKLPDLMYINIQELDRSFVEFMLKHQRDRDETMEEQLIQLQRLLREYNYHEQIRY